MKMCGIIGYIGEGSAATILLNGLKRLEYRGYDSAGICTINQDKIHIKKGVGKVDEIHKRLNFTDLAGNIGIAHTRWATHGKVTDANAHPHTSCGEIIAIVHNGTLENHQELKDTLIREGHTFKSETDSEVIAHLIEKFYLIHKDEERAVLNAANMLKGTFAFVTIFRDNPNILIGVRKDSPLVLGIDKGGYFLASDILAFIDHTDRVIFLDNREVAVVNRGGVKILTFDGLEVSKSVTQVAWEVSDVSKKEFAHFTIKEIHEQPYTVRAALIQDMNKVDEFCNEIKAAKRVYVVGCGTSYHASLMAKHLFSKLSKVHVESIIASEFSHYGDLSDGGTILIAISQSGETADVLDVVREARRQGVKVFSIVNSMNSSLVRESDMSLFINCGPEIGVAATKSFTSQLVVIYLLALRLSNLSVEDFDLPKLPRYVREVLKLEGEIQKISKKYYTSGDFYYVGRGPHFPIALEGALKLKELAYIHAEGMPAGELKHGTLALISDGTPVVVLNPHDETYFETLGNASEMKARGAKIIGVSNIMNEIYDDFIQLPTVNKLLYPIIEVIPLQLLAYHITLARKHNPDYPRNLAKSVTVK
ncbi:MAG: glutamine--fructose-6-phosphate transaminase (isomerizing) [Nitrososphaerota archaeon]|nr:glutamine--fructose-6-phosphate transaminase (isomerizing) [Nitrososphaerota archaeon]